MIKTERPTWLEVQSWVGYILCSCGQTLQHQAETREHWQMGHFDRVKEDSLCSECGKKVSYR